MNLDIEGNPGSHNHFEETRIENVETLCPNATSVVNDHSVTVRINFSLSVNLNGEMALSLFKTLRREFHLTFERLRPKHFDGEGSMETMVCQLSGSPAAIAAALRRVREAWGEDASETIWYFSKDTCFERGRLTLSDALKIADDESGL